MSHLSKLIRDALVDSGHKTYQASFAKELVLKTIDACMLELNRCRLPANISEPYIQQLSDMRDRYQLEKIS